MRHFAARIALAMVLLAAPILPTVYYVAPTGNDTTGDGTSAKPWATPRYACDHVAADQGHVIHIRAGTYYDSLHIAVKTGVSLEGDGPDKTTLRNDNQDLYQGFINLGSWQVLTDGNQYIRDLRIRGMNFVAWSGIKVENRRHVKIINVRADSCKLAGIELRSKGEDILIDSCLMYESSTENTSSSSGTITLAGSFRDVTISNTAVSHWGQTGYGIKAYSDWTPDGHIDTLWNLRILNCTVLGKKDAPWSNYMAPNISLEFNAIALSECEIAGCTVNNNISLVCFQKVAGKFSMWLHDNLIQPQASTCIEYGTDRVIMDHNFFDFSKTLTNPESGTKEFNTAGMVRDGIIHHNVFYGYNATVMAFSSTVRNLSFMNNTCVGSDAYASGFISLGNAVASDSFIIRNNVFMSKKSGGVFVKLGSQAALGNHNVVTNNIVRAVQLNVQGTIASNDTMDPGLRTAGAMPSPFFNSLSASGPTVDRGVDVGYPFRGAAPDIGAYEWEGVTSVKGPIMRLTAASHGARIAMTPLIVFDLAGRRAVRVGDRVAPAAPGVCAAVNGDERPAHAVIVK